MISGFGYAGTGRRAWQRLSFRDNPAMDGQRAAAKRLSLAHCHAAGNGVHEIHLVAGTHNLTAETVTYRLLHFSTEQGQYDDQPMSGPFSCILRPGASCRWVATKAMTCGSVVFTARLPGSIDALAVFHGALTVQHPAESLVPAAWRTLHGVKAALRQGDAWARPRLRALVTELLALTVADGFRSGGWHIVEPGRPDWLRAVLQRLDEDLAVADLDVAALAAGCAMSPSRFAHQFRDVMGMPPKRYLLQRRLERAQTLLSTTDIPIKTIAAACGFRDADVFSDAFRRSTGSSPSIWRTRR